jgi:hypothetical protein
MAGLYQPKGPLYLEKRKKTEIYDGSTFLWITLELSSSIAQLMVRVIESIHNILLPFRSTMPIEISSQPRRPLYDRRVIPTHTTYDYAAEYPLSPTANSPTTSNNGVTPLSIAINNITFPPPPNSNVPPLSSSPSSMASRAATNALNRALSIASKKLFGHSHSHSHSSSGRSPSRDLSSAPPSPRRPQIILLDADGERDPLEDELLGLLEELAQKTDVLTHWADEMYEYVKAIPQSLYFLFIYLVVLPSLVGFFLTDSPHLTRTSS